MVFPFCIVSGSLTNYNLLSFVSFLKSFFLFFFSGESSEANSGKWSLTVVADWITVTCIVANACNCPTSPVPEFVYPPDIWVHNETAAVAWHSSPWIGRALDVTIGSVGRKGGGGVLSVELSSHCSLSKYKMELPNHTRETESEVASASLKWNDRINPEAKMLQSFLFVFLFFSRLASNMKKSH